MTGHLQTPETWRGSHQLDFEISWIWHIGPLNFDLLETCITDQIRLLEPLLSNWFPHV